MFGLCAPELCCKECVTIDRSHLGWAAVTVGATAVAGTLYALTFYPDASSANVTSSGLLHWLRGGSILPLTNRAGGTPLGLIYGSVALAIFFFAALIGSRRKHPNWRVGSMQTWLKGHIWLTLLTIPLVIFHSGVHTGGPLTQFLLLLYTVVMVSGLYGLTLQNLLPHLMKQVLTEEVVFEQIPFLCSKLVEDAQRARKDLQSLISEDLALIKENALATAIQIKSEVAFRLIDQEVIPFLGLEAPRQSRLGRESSAERLFKFIAQEVPAQSREPVERIKVLCEEKRRMNIQTTFQLWLHGWILLHAPISLLLIVVTIWHAFVAAYVY